LSHARTRTPVPEMRADGQVHTYKCIPSRSKLLPRTESVASTDRDGGSNPVKPLLGILTPDSEEPKPASRSRDIVYDRVAEDSSFSVFDSGDASPQSSPCSEMPREHRSL
jgi:hypothetical protein